MKLLLIAILVFIIIILNILKVIDEKNTVSQEAFDMVNFAKNNKNDSRGMGQYYYNLMYGNLDEITKELDDTTKINDFLRFNEEGVLVEGAVGSIGTTSTKKTESNIELCRSLTKCEQLKNYPQCGYCGSTNQFEYAHGKKKDENGVDIDIGPNVCPRNKKNENQWARTEYDCTKLQSQKTCAQVKTCTQMDPSTKQGKLCGWCQGDSSAKVATNDKKPQLLYDGVRKGEEKSKIKSDSCYGLNMPDPEFPDEGPLFDSLTKAGNCSVCDEPVDGKAVGMTGLHSDECLNSLWQAAYFNPESNLNVTCKTEYNKQGLNEDIAAKYNINKPYFKIGRQMTREINKPLERFYRDFKDTDSWSIVVDAPDKNNRRSKNLSNIDKIWKQCFGKNRKDEEL